MIGCTTLFSDCSIRGWHCSVIILNQGSFFKERFAHHVLHLCRKGLQLKGWRSGPERNAVSLSTTLFWLFVPFCFQVNEIYHEESLGVHINVVLVRMIMLGYAKVSCLFHFSVNVCSLWEFFESRPTSAEELLFSVGEASARKVEIRFE